MTKRLATFLTYLFFPGLVPSYLLGLLLLSTPYIVALSEVDIKYRWYLLGFIAAYTFVFPSLFTLFLYRKGKIESLSLEKLSDRKLPYLSGVVLIFFLAFTFYSKSGELFSVAVILSFIGITISAVALISLWWQISAHAAGMGGLVGAIGTLMLIYDEPFLRIPFFVLLIAAGAVISARLKLGAHTQSQVYTGFFLGLIISIVGSFFV